MPPTCQARTTTPCPSHPSPALLAVIIPGDDAPAATPTTQNPPPPATHPFVDHLTIQRCHHQSVTTATRVNQPHICLLLCTRGLVHDTPSQCWNMTTTPLNLAVRIDVPTNSPSYITPDSSSPGSSSSLNLFYKVLLAQLVRPQVGPHAGGYAGV